MIWGKIRKKRKWEFKKEYREEDIDQILNPARGWYAIYTFRIEEKIDPQELKWSVREGESLALLRIDISAYREKKLDEVAVKNFENILRFFQQYQKDVILRPLYDVDGSGREKEPKDFLLVMAHLKQIGEILERNPYSVFIFQGMLIGSWGEMHDSNYLSKEHLLQMLGCLDHYLGREIYLAVRTPVQWRILSKEKQEKLCIFDDAIFGSGSHLGTFGTMTKEAAGWERPWAAKEELSFLNETCKMLPCGGEALFPSDGKEYKDEEIIRQMKQIHLCYLNAVYDQRMLDSWKEKKLEGSKWGSLFDYIGAHLGYRFVAGNILLEKQKRKEVYLRGMIKNTGFGVLPQDAELFLLIHEDQKEVEKKISIDLKKIIGGSSQQFVVKISQTKKARLFLQIRRVKDNRVIFFANKNATEQLYLGCLWQD